jgi:hypothetical protein
MEETRKINEEIIEKEKKLALDSAECSHDNWDIQSIYPHGKTRCIDCGQYIQASIAFNNLQLKMRASIKEAEEFFISAKNR